MLLSYKKPVTASSTAADSAPALAVNEDCRSWWSAGSAQSGEWLCVDLGQASDVRAIQVNLADEKLVVDFPADSYGEDVYKRQVIALVMIAYFAVIDPTKIAAMGPLMVIYVLLNLAFNGAKMCVTTSGTAFMADVIDYELYRSGQFVPAVVSGTYSLLDKLISSFGALIATGAVALLGYTTTMPQPGDPCTTPLFRCV